MEAPEEYYAERTATREQTAAYWPPAEDGATTFRYFTVRFDDGSNPHGEMSLSLSGRVMKLYDMYRESGGEPVGPAFASFIRETDSYLAAMSVDLRPNFF